MTKTRRQRRAEAVERLTEMREKGDYNVYCIMSVLVGEIDNEWTGDRDYADLIDLLSEDTCEARVTTMYENLHGSDTNEQNRRSDGGDSGTDVTFDPEKVTFDDASRLSDLYGIWRKDKEPSLSEDKRADEQELSQDDLATIYRLGLGNVDSVQFVDESDTRDQSQSPDSMGLENETRNDTRARLEADLWELMLKWRGYDGNYMRVYASVAYAQVKAMLDRQAAITRRECADELDNMCDSRERIYDRVCDNLTAKILDRDTEIAHVRDVTGEMVRELWYAYKLTCAQSNCWHAREHKFRKERDKWRAKAEQVDHMRKACAEMVAEMWHAYELMCAQSNCWLSQAHKTGDALRDLRAVRDACADMVEELWRGLAMWRDRSEDMRMELADAESFAERVEGCVTKGEPVTLFGVDYVPERKPIVGKDGTLIAMGDVVYGEDGVRFDVSGFLRDKEHCVVGKLPNGSCKELRPRWLTHECPDTVDMVRHDLLMGPREYCERHGLMPKTEDRMTFDVEKAKCLMLAHIADRVREMGRQ